jgi:MSHA biogenesis protein MshK
MMILNQKFLQLKQCLSFSLALANILCISISFADTLKDPTAPPASLNTVTTADNTVATGPVLQSIMIGPQTHAAIINGQKVLLGQKYQAATLIKLNEHQAVLSHPDMSTQILSMDFAVDKKLTTPIVDDYKRQQKSKEKVKHQSKLNTKIIELSEK